jgi:hypothetical protein
VHINDKRKWCLKKQMTIHYRGFNVLNMQKDPWFASNFEKWNIANNGTYCKRNISNLIFFFFLVIFQRKQKTLLSNVCPFRWFLWLCFHLKLQVWKWENHLWILGIFLTFKWECVWILKHYLGLLPFSCLSLGHEPKVKVIIRGIVWFGVLSQFLHFSYPNYNCIR